MNERVREDRRREMKVSEKGKCSGKVLYWIVLAQPIQYKKTIETIAKKKHNRCFPYPDEVIREDQFYLTVRIKGQFYLERV